MSCADVMYQPYSPYFPYHQRPQAGQPLAAPAQASTDYRKFSSVKAPLVEGSSPTPSPPTEGEKGAEKAEAQYLSANCVLFTYYSGDISSVVDEHFARALSQAAYAVPAPPEAKGSSAPGHSSKDGPPMSHRNFPPSFWNSNYQPMPNSNLGPMGPGALGSLGPDLTYGGDPYHPHAGPLHATLHHQNDPWHYTLTGQPPFSSSYHPAAGGPRFAPQYGSLLLQRSAAGRLGPAAAACASLEKAADSWGAARYHDSLGHVDTNYGAAYSAMTPMPGLEGQPQDSKDLYWF
ncbi:uncharacterized protein NPIL_469641 [Nephila pilipes]|uniref:Transcription cofactor vestigial-like protein 2 n=1 Tax=Nephila pilipes TaxID=299642 RepID=A0A8X6TI48_NEPPI|nr:uncharacterized protein NPIL_469641 [Nephila pilipes]